MVLTIHKKLNDIMADIQAIEKNKTNAQQGFKFRGIDQVYNELHGLMKKHRVFCVPKVLEIIQSESTTSKGSTMYRVLVKVEYTFTTDDGSVVTTTIYGEGSDMADKATSKALAIAHKYALVQMFMIPTEDMIDGDSVTPEPTVKPEGVKTPAKQIKKEVKKEDPKIDTARKLLMVKFGSVEKIVEFLRAEYNVGFTQDLTDEQLAGLPAKLEGVK